MNEVVRQSLDDHAQYMTHASGARKGFLASLNHFSVWSQAAEQGCPEACFLVAKCFSEGIHCGRDMASAHKWYARGAELNEPACQLNLGLMVSNGEVVKQDAAQAAQLFKQAAEQGSRLGQYHLAVAYEKGKGVEEDSDEAIGWYQEALAQGLTLAEAPLVKLMWSRDADAARQWFAAQAAAGNDAVSQTTAYVAAIDALREAETREARVDALRTIKNGLNSSLKIIAQSLAPDVVASFDGLIALTSKPPGRDLESMQRWLDLYLDWDDPQLPREVLCGPVEIDDHGRVVDPKGLHYKLRQPFIVIGMRLADESNNASLEHLDLSRSRLDTLPQGLASMKRLKALSLNHNNLTQWPDGLTQLATLETLDFGRNKLDAVPDEIGALTALKTLNLSLNRAIASLPETIGALPELERLYLGHNALSALPDALTKLRKLRYLGLGHNKFTELPAFLSELPALEGLNVVGNNGLRELPPALAESRSLHTIFAGYGNYEPIAASAAALFGDRVKVIESGWRR